MKYVKGTTEIHIEEPTVISLGKFDGLHMGHKLLVETMMEKKQQGLKTVLFTFQNPPKSVVEGEIQSVLTTNEEKEQVFAMTGIDYLVEFPFTEQVRRMSPKDFIKMLVEQLNVKCIVVGTDFKFGYNRSGNYETLEEYSSSYGYETIIVKKKEFEQREISSTFIREEILAGNIEKANMLLGYEYFVKGEVVHGKQIGRTLGIPTVNQIPIEEKLLPPFGVYVSKVVIDGIVYGGITNIGKKPTIEGLNPIGVETHVFNFNGDLYGKVIDVHFLHFLRSEKKFSSIEELKQQMIKDMEEGKIFLQKL